MSHIMTSLRAIGWPFKDKVRYPEWASLMAAHPSARPARVIEQHRSGYILAESPSDAYPAQSLPEWRRRSGYKQWRLLPGSRPVVGDWVLVNGTGAMATIAALLPRYSAIKRAAAGAQYQQQLIAANIDTVFIVCGLDGDFNVRRIERYLMLVQGSGVEAVVVLTKLDRNCRSELQINEDLETVTKSGIHVIKIDSRDSESVEQLRDWLLPGCSVALIGSSGAGKSTLTNTLSGTQKMKTQAVRHCDARGRHTTTHRALISLPQGICMIDTPGMRELKPTGEESISDHFSEVASLASQCKFRNCSHIHEPGCAVRAAVIAGTLSAERCASYIASSHEVQLAADRHASYRDGKYVS